jgi:hypothetical protein
MSRVLLCLMSSSPPSIWEILSSRFTGEETEAQAKQLAQSHSWKMSPRGCENKSVRSQSHMPWQLWFQKDSLCGLKQSSLPGGEPQPSPQPASCPTTAPPWPYHTQLCGFPNTQPMAAFTIMAPTRACWSIFPAWFSISLERESD